MKNQFTIFLLLLSINFFAMDHKNIVSSELKAGNFPLIENGFPGKILIDENDDSAVKIAVSNLQKDFERVSGRQAEMMLYPTVARRIVETETELQLPKTEDGQQTLIIKPMDPGIVFEKIIVDFGGYEKTYLFMNESPFRRAL